jgi:hypothetical protein
MEKSMQESMKGAERQRILTRPKEAVGNPERNFMNKNN